MILVDRENPKISFGTHNSLFDDGSTILDITGSNKIYIKFSQVKFLRDHLDGMIKEYEAKNNSKSTGELHSMGK